MEIVYSAPLSFIMSGGPGIPYGKPALALATNYRLKVNINNTKENNSSGVEKIEEEITNFLTRRRISFKRTKFSFNVQKPTFYFGDSSYMATRNLCLVAGILKLYTNKTFDNDVINKITYSIEKKNQKYSTGLLTTASCFGGLIFYRREFEFLKTVSRLDIKIPKKIEDKLYFIQSTEIIDEDKAIDSLGKQYNKNPKKFEDILNQLEKTIKRLLVSITQESASFFRKNLEENQLLLDKLGLVSPKTKKLISSLQKIGSVTVVDYGEPIIGYFEDEKQLKEITRVTNLKYFKFTQSERGLSIQSIPTSTT